MAILDLSSKLGKVRNRIDKVGIELEGGWTLPHNPKIRFVNDGSVFHDHGRLVPPPGLPGREIGVSVYAGEAPSPPLEPSGINAWMAMAYPQHHNHTCGLHVHMSFANAKHYGLLTKIDYQDTLLHYLTQWAKHEEATTPGTFPEDHHIWPRLAGLNDFCLAKFWPEKQIPKSRKVYGREEVGHRYTAVNFCFGVHRTVEIRVLPMFNDVERAKRAVRATLDITNASLVLLAAKSEIMVEQITLLPENLYEEVDQELL